MPSAVPSTIGQYVLAFLGCSELPPTVDRSVSSTRTAPCIWHVWETNVEIPVRDLVESMHNATSRTTGHFASVSLASKVILSQVAHPWKVSSKAFQSTLTSILVLVVEILPSNPCNPSPCGPNAICREHNGAGSCSCLPDYFGDPYTGCRPECLMSSDCPFDKACLSLKCIDPCPGSCGINAECRVINHIPECSCVPGFTGDARGICKEVVTICKTFHQPHIYHL